MNECPWCYGSVDECGCADAAVYYDGLSPEEWGRELEMIARYVDESDRL